jgi:rhodanese-related sulfurtransferase
MDSEMTVPIRAALESHGVTVMTGKATSAIEKTETGLAVALADGTRIATDLVILCMGVTPETTIAKNAGIALGINGAIVVDEHMRTSDPNIYACGDAVQVTNYVTGQPGLLALAGPATRQGRVAAASIAGKEDETFSGVNGTAIVKGFEICAGLTGITEKAAKKLNIPNVAKAYIFQAGSVEWLPGSSPLIIKVLYDSKTGRLLGIQATGRKGLDKRLDAASVAIQGRLTVKQLAQVELAYAPQYNGPKDPLNIAGFVCGNVMDGLDRMTFPDEIPKGALIVDLREPAELPVQGEIPGAVCISANQLRTRYTELPKDRPIVLACKVGGRGHAAFRFLKQKGFDNLYNLSGGAMVFTLFNQPEIYKRHVSSGFF